MLSEVLSALKGLRAELQDQLAQQPEYRALLILETATSQLGDALALDDNRGLKGSGRPGQAESAAPQPSVRGAARLVVVHDAAAPPTPDEAQSETPPAELAANEPALAPPPRPATVADFRIAAPQEQAQEDDSASGPESFSAAEDVVDCAATPAAAEIASATAASPELAEGLPELRDGEGAAPPPTVVEILDPPSATAAPSAAEEVDGRGGGPSHGDAISGLAALYASAGEFSDAAVPDEGAASAAIDAEDVDAALMALESADAPPSGETLSGIAALYESAGELPDAAPHEDGAGAPLPPIAAEDDRWASVRASLVPSGDVVDAAPPPPAATLSGYAALYQPAEEETSEAEGEVAAAPSSGLAAALYESTGDAPELESEAFAPAQALTVEAPVETAIEAFNRTLAEAAEAAKLSAPAKASSARGFLPTFTTQRLAQSKR